MLNSKLCFIALICISLCAKSAYSFTAIGKSKSSSIDALGSEAMLTTTSGLGQFSDSYGHNFKIHNKFLRKRPYYTQGLFYVENRLIESSGLYGDSVLQELKLNNVGKIVAQGKSVSLKNNFFGEGCDILEDSEGKKFIYQLTWRSGKIFKYNMKLELVDQFILPKPIQEGWGITHNPEKPTIAIISDGTTNLYECDTEDNFKILNTINVSKQGIPLYYLNELEWVKGKVWANVFMSSEIAKIDLSSGEVKSSFNLRNIVDQASSDSMAVYGRFLEYGDVLNGIAYNAQTDMIYITGKKWPHIYEIGFEDLD